MTSKRHENINLVSFICFSFLVISFSKQLLIKYLMPLIIWIRFYSQERLFGARSYAPSNVTT